MIETVDVKQLKGIHSKLSKGAKNLRRYLHEVDGLLEDGRVIQAHKTLGTDVSHILRLEIESAINLLGIWVED